MRSLYFRVFLITAAVILASSLLGFFFSNMYYHAQLKPFNDEKLLGIAEQIKQFAEEEPQLVDAYLTNAAALGYEMYLTDGEADHRFYGQDFRERDLNEQAIEEVLGGGRYHGVAQFPNKLFISGFFDNRLSNTVGVPVQLADREFALFIRPDVILQFGELRSFFAWIIVLTVAISILLFLISTRYLVKPITRLSEATKRMARGDFKLSLSTKRKDEIGQLAGHFMIMSRELERMDQSRQQFVANVSHEIQSPLTSIQGFSKVLAEGSLPDEERARYASIIEEESRHLSLLSKQLLVLSSLDQERTPLTKTTFSLLNQIRKTVQMLDWQLEKKELLLKIAVPASLKLQGDEVLFMQVWMNLLGNAVEHIPAGRAIEMTAEQSLAQIVIKIKDNGDGIGKEHLPFLFDRFYRADKVRERSSGRSGLGLAIVKKIVQLHGGQIEVESSKDGTCFTIVLPQL
ncbi:HAMP domain-containing sensor histidine kinase [Paenibacillus sp. HB172176]|uniref:sensor histidine kinase n=1 Tax=Paenibacillus sp. HB172176 TaxID=2493690 RepID=UPI0014394BB0|nr:HAMP domain-containing sensor histidine kinase [Paenibacillus sp. HB172176]